MAEGLLRHRIKERGFDGIEVGSAGTASVDGLNATANAVRAAALKGVDISSHRSRSLSRSLIREADIVLAMERSHVTFANSLGGEGKTYLLTGFPDEGGEEVKDPVGGSPTDYQVTIDLIDVEVRRILPHLSV